MTSLRTELLKEARACLADPAGMTMDIVNDAAKFKQFLDDCDARTKSVIARIDAHLAKPQPEAALLAEELLDRNENWWMNESDCKGEARELGMPNDADAPSVTMGDLRKLVAALRSAQPAAVPNAIQRFFDKHALGDLALPSCFKCGHAKPREEWAITHGELPDIYICKSCVEPAAVEMEPFAQLALDQTSDDPQPGDWNDACEHIAKLIRQSATPPQREPAEQRELQENFSYVTDGVKVGGPPPIAKRMFDKAEDVFRVIGTLSEFDPTAIIGRSHLLEIGFLLREAAGRIEGLQARVTELKDDVEKLVRACNDLQGPTHLGEPVLERGDNISERVTVPRKPIEWLKEKYPALCEKSGLCGRIGGRLYTKTYSPPQREPARKQGASPLHGKPLDENGDIAFAEPAQGKD